MSSHLVFRGGSLSRRRFVSSLAGAAAASSTLVLAATTARAQAPEWREYREEELGFRIEAPVEFSFERLNRADDEETTTEFIRTTTGQGEFDNMSLSVLAFEYRAPIPVDDAHQFFREGLFWQFPPNREQPSTVSGVPAWDFVRDADDVYFNYRGVVVDTRLIMIAVIGSNGRGNSIVPRFLDSLALLRGGLASAPVAAERQPVALH
jgi:hypothetical protein